MAKRRVTKGQTTIYKIQHRKVKICAMLYLSLVTVTSQDSERSYIRVLGVSHLLILQLEFGTVQTMWSFFIFFISYFISSLKYRWP